MDHCTTEIAVQIKSEPADEDQEVYESNIKIDNDEIMTNIDDKNGIYTNYNQQSYNNSLCTGRDNQELFGFIKDEIDVEKTCLKIKSEPADEIQNVHENNQHLNKKETINDNNSNHNQQLNNSSLCTERDIEELLASIEDESNIEVFWIKTENDSDNDEEMTNNDYISADNNNYSQQLHNKSLCIERNNQESHGFIQDELKIEETYVKIENHSDNEGERIHENNQHSGISRDHGNNESISNDNSDRDLLVNEQCNYKFEHNICKQKLSSDHYVSVHLNIQTGEKFHQCNLCNKKFILKRYLKQHLLKHIDEKPCCYQCNKCDIKFTNKKELKDHLLLHINEKPYQCRVCDKTFLLKRYLKQHLFTHIGVKSYHCNICYSKFRTSQILERHLLLHTKVKPYRCQICAKRFVQKIQLKMHSFVHTDKKPHQCNVCNQKLKTKYSLKSHMLLQHTKRQLYKCHICYKTFKSKYSLKNHVSVQHVEKDYRCDICNKKFITKHHLKAHLLLQICVKRRLNESFSSLY